jgi:hypothetical protein
MNSNITRLHTVKPGEHARVGDMIVFGPPDPSMGHVEVVPDDPTIAALDIAIDMQLTEMLERLEAIGLRTCGVTQAQLVATCAGFSEDLAEWMREHLNEQVSLGNLEQE